MTSYRSAQVLASSPRNATVFIPYGSRDTYDTTFEPGCFSESLRRRLPPVLWSHKADQVVGKVVGFRERADGLELDIRLADPERVAAAGMVSSLLADGMVPGISFGFRDGVSRPHRFLRGVSSFVKALMDEVSFVAKPAIPGTQILALRSAPRLDDDLELRVHLALLGISTHHWR